MITKDPRGGKRENAGRKSPYNEPTTGIKFTVPVSKVEELKVYVNKKLIEWQDFKKSID